MDWFLPVFLIFGLCQAVPSGLLNSQIDRKLVYRSSDRLTESQTENDLRILAIREDDRNNSSSSLEDCRGSGLCPEGIANITLGLAAISVLGILACILWHWEVQSERKTRIKLALERNKIIDRQMEEEKKNKQERVEQFIAKSKESVSQRSPELDGVDSNCVAMDNTLLQASDSELSSDERKELLGTNTKDSQKFLVSAEISNQ